VVEGLLRFVRGDVLAGGFGELGLLLLLILLLAVVLGLAELGDNLDTLPIEA
jgi:hypothetical protein